MNMMGFMLDFEIKSGMEVTAILVIWIIGLIEISVPGNRALQERMSGAILGIISEMIRRKNTEV
jgi:uncharacterized protein (DUF486 family)